MSDIQHPDTTKSTGLQQDVEESVARGVEVDNLFASSWEVPAEIDDGTSECSCDGGEKLSEGLGEIAIIIASLKNSIGVEGAKAAAAFAQVLVSHPNLDGEAILAAIASIKVTTPPIYCSISQIYKKCGLSVISLPTGNKIIYDKESNFIAPIGINAERYLCQHLALALTQKTGTVVIVNGAEEIPNDGTVALRPNPQEFSREAVKNLMKGDHDTLLFENEATVDPARLVSILSLSAPKTGQLAYIGKIANSATLADTIQGARSGDIKMMKVHLNAYMLYISESYVDFSVNSESYAMTQFISNIPSTVKFDVDVSPQALPSPPKVGKRDAVDDLFEGLEGAYTQVPSKALAEPRPKGTSSSGPRKGLKCSGDNSEFELDEYIMGLAKATKNVASHPFSNRSRMAVPKNVLSGNCQKKIFTSIKTYLNGHAGDVKDLLNRYGEETLDCCDIDNETFPYYGGEHVLICMLISRATELEFYWEGETAYLKFK